MIAVPSAESNDVVTVADPQQLAVAADAGWGSRRITVATMDLKIAITVDAGSPLTIEELEKVEDDFYMMKKRTRTFMQTAINKYGVDAADTPPEKCMKVGVSGGPWTTSLMIRKPLAVENYSQASEVPDSQVLP